MTAALSLRFESSLAKELPVILFTSLSVCLGLNISSFDKSLSVAPELYFWEKKSSIIRALLVMGAIPLLVSVSKKSEQIYESKALSLLSFPERVYS